MFRVGRTKRQKESERTKTEFIGFSAKCQVSSTYPGGTTIEEIKRESARVMKATNVGTMYIYQLVGVVKSQAPPVEFEAVEK